MVNRIGHPLINDRAVLSLDMVNSALTGESSNQLPFAPESHDFAAEAQQSAVLPPMTKKP
ncbi:hypothetical protein [Bradyrhizobium genosp. P]|uniref:hypothetical protein n=1 Tax=Bradyrhizobium genosp. P TaxID=83641 RepID=UPI003CEAAF2C